MWGDDCAQLSFCNFFEGLSLDGAWWELLNSWMHYYICIHFLSLFLNCRNVQLLWSSCFIFLQRMPALYLSNNMSLQIVYRTEQQNYKTKGLHLLLALANRCCHLRRLTDIDEWYWRENEASRLMSQGATWKNSNAIVFYKKKRTTSMVSYIISVYFENIG
jgi:hypothetical protein